MQAHLPALVPAGGNLFQAAAEYAALARLQLLSTHLISPGVGYPAKLCSAVMFSLRNSPIFFLIVRAGS